MVRDDPGTSRREMAQDSYRSIASRELYCGLAALGLAIAGGLSCAADMSRTMGDDTAVDLDSVGDQQDTGEEDVHDAAGLPRDASYPQYSMGSSGAQCLCWPNGDTCDFEYDDRKAYDPDLRCPEFEVCTGEPEAAEDSFYGGNCVLPCYVAGADLQVEMGCADGWVCVYREVHWGFEDQFGVSFGACHPGPSAGAGTGF